MITIKKWFQRLKSARMNREPEIFASKIDRCICCGDPIPEGRGVCWRCEHKED